eukprot:jgi/Mesvir1/23803/Mv10617-RA.1
MSRLSPVKSWVPSYVNEDEPPPPPPVPTNRFNATGKTAKRTSSIKNTGGSQPIIKVREVSGFRHPREYDSKKGFPFVTVGVLLIGSAGAAVLGATGKISSETVTGLRNVVVDAVKGFFQRDARPDVTAELPVAVKSKAVRKLDLGDAVISPPPTAAETLKQAAASSALETPSPAVHGLLSPVLESHELQDVTSSSVREMSLAGDAQVIESVFVPASPVSTGLIRGWEGLAHLRMQPRPVAESASPLVNGDIEPGTEPVHLSDGDDEESLDSLDYAVYSDIATPQLSEVHTPSSAQWWRLPPRTGSPVMRHVLDPPADDCSDVANFQRWVNMRTGAADQRVYWYSSGELHELPSGKLLARLEGLDTCRCVVESPTVVHQLSRKIFVYRDVATGGVIRAFNGMPVQPILYPYQHIKYSLKGSEILTEVTQGAGPDIVKFVHSVIMRTLPNSNLVVYGRPVFLDISAGAARYKAYENCDFFLDRLTHSCACSWSRCGNTPPFAETGAMHVVTSRVESFDHLPASMRKFVREEAQMWADAPQSFEEIRSLQAPHQPGQPSTFTPRRRKA